MKPRDPLMGASPEERRDALADVAAPARRRGRRRWAWISYGHIAFAITVLIGWEHLDILWPRSLLPDGVPIGGERRMEGFLTLGDRGRPALLATSAQLLDDGACT